MKSVREVVQAVQGLWNARDGALTRELVRVPGLFGLGQVPAGAAPDTLVRSVCGYCATGCSLDIHLRQDQATNITPTLSYPVNLGAACPKGWEALSALVAPDRATAPLLRNAQGQLEPTTWEVALETFCQRFRGIQNRHGKDSVAFLSTGQLVNEEMALLGCLAKFGMGMVHGDGNTRQCMATAVTAYKESFGFDAPPYTYQDFEESDVIVLVGGNLCLAHPIMWERICRNPHQPQIIVVDPRRTETAASATCHLAIRPKSDLTLFYGLARILIDHGWIDRPFIERHTSGFAEFVAFLQQFEPQCVATETGISVQQLYEVARTIHEGQRVSFWWTMGVNQSYQGVRTAQAIINLALMTGNLGRPGTGANSITGQCNAMGSRLFSNTSSLMAGRDFTNAEHRRQVAEILEIDVECIPDRSSWPYHQILASVERGDIRGLWIICTNPAHSWIDQLQARRVLEKLDFLVVQDMYTTTETASLADLLLPAAGWGEKEGTLTNSERRIGVVRKVARAPGQALADFAIFKLIAEFWGCGELFRRWSDPAATFQILKELTRGTPCDISAIPDYVALEAAGGVQWPCTQWEECDGAAQQPEVNETSRSQFEAPAGQRAASPVRGVSDDRAAGSVESGQQRRLFSDGKFYHADGRARFIMEDVRGLPEGPDKAYPYLLLTGRGTAAQWHTQSRTSKSAVLRLLYPTELTVEMHPSDAQAASIQNGETVRIISRRGMTTARVCCATTVQPGQLFLPMHYEGTNKLTHAIFDPYSHQPSYKDCAVRVEKVPRPEQPTSSKKQPSEISRLSTVDGEPNGCASSNTVFSNPALSPPSPLLGEDHD